MRFSLFSEDNGAGDRTRTYDLMITNQLLYQLSYTGLLGGRDAALTANEDTNKPRLEASNFK